MPAEALVPNPLTLSSPSNAKAGCCHRTGAVRPKPWPHLAVSRVSTPSPSPTSIFDLVLNEDVDMESITAHERKHQHSQVRTMNQEELHGVRTWGITNDSAENTRDHGETTELLESSYTLLDLELQRIPVKKKRAYSKALFLKPSLETDRVFHLKFLRSTLFDVEAAAQRICRFFEEKLSLFGVEKLVKPITLEDMGEEDIDSICNGTAHLLPTTDRAGRRVYFIDYRYLDYKHWKHANRFAWYMSLSALHGDEEFQRRGVVEVFFCSGALEQKDAIVDHMTKGMGGLMCLPIRFAGIHFCYDEPALTPLLRLAQMAFGASNRLRLQPHQGSNLEIQYGLLSYGIQIPPQLLERDETFKHAMIESYLTKQRELDAQRLDNENAPTRRDENGSTLILTPSPMDVLLGKGRAFQEFSGNLHMNRLVDHNLETYKSAASKAHKTAIALEIVGDIHNSGGRFLERQADGWKVVTDEVVQRNKITQAFRVRNRPAKGKASTATVSAAKDKRLEEEGCGNRQCVDSSSS